MDSGNSVGNAMSWEFAQQVGLRLQDLEPDPELPEVKTAKKNSPLEVLGRPKKRVSLRLGGLATRFKIRPIVIKGLTMAFNISGPFLRKHGIDHLHSKQALKIQGKIIPLKQSSSLDQEEQLNQIEPAESLAYVQQDVELPPKSAAFIPLRVPNVEAGLAQPGDVVVQPHASFVAKTKLHPAISAVTSVDPNGRCYTSVMNTSDERMVVPAGARFGAAKKFTTAICSVQKKENTSGRTIDWYIEQFKLKESPHLQRAEDLEAAAALLLEFDDLFTTDDTYGRTDLVEHAIHTGDVPPIKCRHRPLNPALEPNLKEQLNHWLEQDVIEPSTSPWSFPLLAVPKKDGRTRWATDYRRLNATTMKDAFPLPHIEDNLARLSNSRIFSGIDGTGAFHVVSIREQDREKTAFSTPWGLFQFKQMPFGLCNAPATYCRLVQKVLEGIPLSVAIPYLDDTCVHSATLEDHMSGLRRVLLAHRRAGLTLQPKKCQLFQEQIEYLGHQISAAGISVPKAYTKIVDDWPPPASVKDVRTFLGKVSYYRRFIPSFSSVAAPLSDLVKVKDNEDFVLTDNALAAFETLKKKLSTSPILAYPKFDSDQPFIVDTDWSCDPGAIGGVLSQVQDGEERVIAYAAKKLNEAEKNYSSHKGELLAAIFFLRYWKYYLCHRPFVLRTDHEALKWIQRIEEPKGMILRWLETLSNYDFKVEFRKGKKHANADALSRVEHAELMEEEEIKDDFVAAVHMADDRYDQQLLEHQERDEVLVRVKNWISEEKWPTKAERKALDSTSRTYASLQGQLEISPEGLVVRRDPLGLKVQPVRPCVPRALQTPMLLQCHLEGGHRGYINTYEQFTRRFYFPGAAAESALAVKMCKVCQQNQPKPGGQTHTLVSSPIGTPFQKWSIDFVGPLPTSANGRSYILTAKDCFTRWVEAFPTENMTAATVAKTLERELFSRYGVPEQIHSDQGTQFTSALMQSVYKELGISGTTTPAYNPKSNPVERTHRDLGRLLRACVDDHPQDWEDFLPDCLLAMRISVNRTTGFSPFFMLYGREAVLPLDLMYRNPFDEAKSPIEHVNKLRARLETAFKMAREQQGLTLARAKKHYRGRQEGGPLKEGDLVWLFTPNTAGASRKLAIHWTGPWEIINKISEVLYRIRSGPWNVHQVTVAAGLDRLRRYHGTREPLDPGQHDLSARDVDVADEFLELPAEPPVTEGGEPPGAGGEAWGGGGGPGLPPAPAPPLPPLPPVPPGPPPQSPPPGPPPPPDEEMPDEIEEENEAEMQSQDNSVLDANPGDETEMWEQVPLDARQETEPPEERDKSHNLSPPSSPLPPPSAPNLSPLPNLPRPSAPPLPVDVPESAHGDASNTSSVTFHGFPTSGRKPAAALSETEQQQQDRLMHELGAGARLLTDSAEQLEEWLDQEAWEEEWAQAERAIRDPDWTPANEKEKRKRKKKVSGSARTALQRARSSLLPAALRKKPPTVKRRASTASDHSKPSAAAATPDGARAPAAAANASFDSYGRIPYSLRPVQLEQPAPWGREDQGGGKEENSRSRSSRPNPSDAAAPLPTPSAPLEDGNPPRFVRLAPPPWPPGTRDTLSPASGTSLKPSAPPLPAPQSSAAKRPAPTISSSPSETKPPPGKSEKWSVQLDVAAGSASSSSCTSSKSETGARPKQPPPARLPPPPTSPTPASKRKGSSLASGTSMTAPPVRKMAGVQAQVQPPPPPQPRQPPPPPPRPPEAPRTKKEREKEF